MNLDNVNILLVEDNPDDALLLREQISELDGPVICLEHVSDLSEAHAFLVSEHVDAVLLDLGLPDSEGLETLDRFRRGEPELPVIVLTGNHDYSLGVEAVRHHAQDFLVKGKASGTLIAKAVVFAIERSNLRRQLVRSDKLAAIGQLAAGVAHEVRNPLAYVMSNLQVLERYFDKIEEFIESVQHCHARSNSAEAETLRDLARRLRIHEVLVDAREIIADDLDGLERIRAITSELSVFSRVENERTDAVDLNEAVKDALKLTESHRKTRARLETDFAEMPTIAANRARLTQVLTNLLINAVQSLQEGSDDHVITVTTFAEHDLVGTRIRDTGCGIPTDIADRIFDPFFTTKAPGEGTGLGLAISADIVRHYGGEIVLESEVGRGTCFEVRLPLET